MSGRWLALLEALLVLGAVFGFGLHQLWSLRRAPRAELDDRSGPGPVEPSSRGPDPS